MLRTRPYDEYLLSWLVRPQTRFRSLTFKKTKQNACLSPPQRLVSQTGICLSRPVPLKTEMVLLFPSFSFNFVTLSWALPLLQNCSSHVIHSLTQLKTECIAFGRGIFRVLFDDTAKPISPLAVTETTQCSSLLPSNSCSFPCTSIMQEPGEQGKERQ